ncbi:MAG: ribosomal protein S18-alanine N-acetyltransferase [Elusimicrobiota bacterium]
MIRLMRKEEALVFSEWEKYERPYPWSEKNFSQSIDSESSENWVLELDSNPVAFLVIQVVMREAHILNIMVKPDFRKRGLAEKLLKNVFDEMKFRVDQVFLDVEINNTPALSLYKKLGFDVCDRRESSYPRGESAFVMRKNLK